MTTQNHYTFGDSERAARRLALLARAYDEPSRALIERFRPQNLALALDLGSGPGHTTRLLHEVARARRTVGLDVSPRYVEQARVNAPPGVEFVVHDVLEPPYPVAPARLVFCRFFMTHVADPARALTSLRALLSAGGRLLLQETSELSCPHPVFQRYYELVAQLQSHYGQNLYIGRELAAFTRHTPFELAHAADRRFERPAPVMAELHALNITTWKKDPFAARTFDAAELDALEARLWAIARGAEAAPAVSVGLAEVVLAQSPRIR